MNLKPVIQSPLVTNFIKTVKLQTSELRYIKLTTSIKNNNVFLVNFLITCENFWHLSFELRNSYQNFGMLGVLSNFAATRYNISSLNKKMKTTREKHANQRVLGQLFGKSYFCLPRFKPLARRLTHLNHLRILRLLVVYFAFYLLLYLIIEGCVYVYIHKSMIQMIIYSLYS